MNRQRTLKPPKSQNLAIRSQLAWALAMLIVGFTLADVVYAQEQNPAAEPPKTQTTPSDVRLSLESVTTRLKAAEALEGQEELKAKLVPLLTKTADFLKQEAALAKEAEKFRFDPQTLEPAPAETAPAVPDKNRETEIRESEDLTKLRSELDVRTQNLNEKANQLKELDQWDQIRKERQDAVPRELTAVNQRLDELKQAPKLPEEESPEITQARRDLARAEIQLNEQKQNKLLLEQKYYNSESVPQKKLQEKTTLTREIDRARQLAQVYRKRITELEYQAAKTLETKIELLLSTISPNLKPRVEAIQQRSKERTGPHGLIQRELQLSKQHYATRERLNSLNSHRSSTESYLEYISNSESLASLLDTQRAMIPSVRQYEQEIIAHSREYATVRSRLPELKREIESLANTETRVEEMMEEIAPDDSDQLEREARTVLDLELELLLALQSDLDKNANVLSDLISAEGEMIRFANDYEAYLDSKSMWVRVSGVYSFDHLTHALESSKNLLRIEPWRMFFEKLVGEIYEHAVYSGAIVIAMIVFLFIHARIKQQLQEYHEQVSSEILAPFALTRKAFGLTLILALWIPVLLGIVGYQISLLETNGRIDASRIQRIRQDTEIRGLVGNDEAFVSAIGTSLYAAAFLFGVLRLTRVLCRPQGLGDIHFRWSKTRTLRVRRNLRWFVWTVVPTTFFLVLVQSAGNTQERDSLGRGLLTIVLLLSALFLYRVLAPIRPSDARSSRVELTFTEKLTVYTPVMVPLVFVLLTLIGYSETTPKLATRLVETSVVIILLVMINEMAFRWLYIARGKIALEQARQRQEAREQAEAETGDVPPAADAKPTGLDLSAINIQTRNLLTTSFRLAVFVALWLLWGDVTPRFGILDYQLWKTDQFIQVAQAATGDNPAEIISDTARWITLGDLLLFVLLLGVTVVAARNLPGLLEVTVLLNLPLDTGVRYAAGMLAKYCLLAVGILIAMNVINLGVTQMSFVLGGLAVGLGFGLQELFANFVSGIILLFEQPLRIGDIVSIGDVTGTVTKIRIRATTVTDWDRKEYIIPNKELITGTFRNWTLSDKTNRIVIEVGVAYGSNTDQARRLLLDVCREHPRVLKDPLPSAAFDRFGDSALNLTLRCFLADFEDRLNVIHELHTAIDRKFKQAKIEIAFPQMDLHLRSIDKSTEPLPLRQSNPSASE
ncbi:MAG TPA: mechanosensitive ion channel domain-containing protein [Planctomycetaceae bacterium]|nr:mechanosensitive ion channel domain-containing protein [Planctomycetaceae bacterium]